MSYDQVFFYIVLAGVAVFFIGAAVFLWRANRGQETNGRGQGRN